MKNITFYNLRRTDFQKAPLCDFKSIPLLWKSVFCCFTLAWGCSWHWHWKTFQDFGFLGQASSSALGLGLGFRKITFAVFVLFFCFWQRFHPLPKESTCFLCFFFNYTHFWNTLLRVVPISFLNPDSSALLNFGICVMVAGLHPAQILRS